MALFNKLKKQISEGIYSAQEQIKDKAEELNSLTKVKEYQETISFLESENNRLLSLVPSDVADMEKTLSELTLKKTTKEAEIQHLTDEIERLNNDVIRINHEIDAKKKELVVLDDEALYQDFGLYSPIYDLVSSEVYKNKITLVRQKQKDMIQLGTACTYSKNMTFNNSLSKGQKIVKDNVKQVLRTFNNECEMLISKVKYNNIESIRKRIIKSKESLEKLNKAMEIQIKEKYLKLKLDELNLCHEYALKKQEEKEKAKEERERLREEAKLAKEIEEARKSIMKEQKHYTNALDKLNSQIANSTPEEREDLLNKKQEIEEKLVEIDASIKNIDYREANKRAGYVYIISNIGSFGPNVYKIGMTRRLEPMDRINELGDASVPFNFDVHAMIFSDDAPALENALHKAFEDKKVNMVNQRREFFNVSLEEIEEVVRKNYDKTVDFIKTPSAEQFRETQMIQKNL